MAEKERNNHLGSNSQIVDGIVKNTRVGDESTIARSTMDGCVVGSNVSLDGVKASNCGIADGCTLRNSHLAEGVSVPSNACMDGGLCHIDPVVHQGITLCDDKAHVMCEDGRPASVSKPDLETLASRYKQPKLMRRIFGNDTYSPVYEDQVAPHAADLLKMMEDRAPAVEKAREVVKEIYRLDDIRKRRLAHVDAPEEMIQKKFGKDGLVR